MAARTARSRSNAPRGRSSSGRGSRTPSSRGRGGGGGGRPRDPQAEIDRLLKAGQKEWDASKEEVKNIGADNRVPAGTYEVRLVSLLLIAKDSKLSLMRKHMVVEGEYEGDTITDFMRFTSENGAKSKAYIRKYFETLEVEIPGDSSEMPTLCKDLTDEGYEGKLRVWFSQGRDREFLNAELLEAYPTGPQGAASEAVSGSDDAAAPAGDALGGDDKSLDDMDKAELSKLIAAESIPVKGIRRKTPDQLRAEIRAYDETQDGASGAEAGAGSEPQGDDPTDLKTLAAFCKAQAIELKGDDAQSIEAMCKTISKYEYERDKLDKEDVAMLESFKLGDLIVEPQAAAPPARRSRR